MGRAIVIIFKCDKCEDVFESERDVVYVTFHRRTFIEIASAIKDWYYTRTPVQAPKASQVCLGCMDDMLTMGRGKLNIHEGDIK